MNTNELAEVCRLHLQENRGSLRDVKLLRCLEADGLVISFDEMCEALETLDVDWCDVGDEDRGPVDLVILRAA